VGQGLDHRRPPRRRAARPLPRRTEVAGEVVEIVPPSHIVFTYGFVKGTPIAPGESRVTIRLEPAPRGTRLHLVHAFADAPVRDQHVQGWRYQLSLFANVVTDEIHRDAAELVDAWFTAWAEPDASTRTATLSAIASADVRMRDRFSSVDGVAELTAHIGAAQHHIARHAAAAKR
jgi:hypothetical protein